jgi:hypothetical protein
VGVAVISDYVARVENLLRHVGSTGKRHLFAVDRSQVYADLEEAGPKSVLTEKR